MVCLDTIFNLFEYILKKKLDKVEIWDIKNLFM